MNSAAATNIWSPFCVEHLPECLRPHQRLKVPLEQQRLLLGTRRVPATSPAGLGASRARPQPPARAVGSRLRGDRAVWPARPAGRRSVSVSGDGRVTALTGASPACSSGSRCVLRSLMAPPPVLSPAPDSFLSEFSVLSFVASVATGHEEWPCSLQSVLCHPLSLRVAPHPGSRPAPCRSAARAAPPGEQRAGQEDSRPWPGH